MKPGKLQLTLVFLLLALAIAYNVWVFTRPARRSPAQAPERPLLESVQATGPVVTGELVAEVVDPRTLPPVPDVGLDRAPEWPRNPFINVQLPAMERTSSRQTPEAVAEPELVVASILHSPQRRLAIINGRIMRVGDRVGSSTILEIEPRAVILESPGGARQTLELRVPLRRPNQ